MHVVLIFSSPVETKTFAFVRNTIALIAISAVALRTVTALLRAQNQFETRIQSRECFGVDWGSRDLQILVVCYFQVFLRHNRIHTNHLEK